MIRKKALLSILLTASTIVGSDKWIVVTTINYPTDALKNELAKTRYIEKLRTLSTLPDWKLLVVADKKTPKDWELPNCEFLSVEKQLNLDYEITKVLPWNHYCRKNIGYLYAIEHGAQVIYDTDDDNYIQDGIQWFDEYFMVSLAENVDKVVNPYAYFGQPTVWPRGYPLNAVTTKKSLHFTKTDVRSPIQQGVVNKEPDVDAIFRLTRGEYVDFEFQDPIALPKGSMCPYNTQNTIIHYSAFWSLLIPHKTSFRVCDIWRGYIMQRLLWDIGAVLSFFYSDVVQERNDHNLLKDFEDEIDLYLKSGHLVDFLIDWHSDETTIFDRLRALTNDLIKNKFLTHEELVLVDAWIKDLIKIGYKQPKLR